MDLKSDLDITHIRGLDQIHLLADGHLSLGAAVRHSALCEAAGTPVPAVLAAAARLVGSAAVRSLGTSVGSIAFADPAAEIPAVLLLLGGRVHLVSPRGYRSLAARRYLEAAPADRRAPDELITRVDFRLPPDHAGTAVTEVSPRHGDRALAGTAAFVQISADGTLAQVRLCLWGTTPVPRLADLTGPLRGRSPRKADWAEALAPVLATLDPPAMPHAGADYLRHLAKVTARRALATAARRASPARIGGGTG
ncbi:FAD binding domain-containing protein [Kitasatospora purpeofusca]|uniref:FAD binding domain-containing protein n=1 Tax=Kitasatospora purpeofusca TaxID=67352 RepID=UPI002B1DFC9B|nr:FAD binding domain-containing protein [Kitasatospora purpeofusca]